MGENDEQGSINSFGINERFWSGRGDLNARPPAPKAGALPGCATPRQVKNQRDTDG